MKNISNVLHLLFPSSDYFFLPFSFAFRLFSSFLSFFNIQLLQKTFFSFLSHFSIGSLSLPVSLFHPSPSLSLTLSVSLFHPSLSPSQSFTFAILHFFLLLSLFRTRGIHFTLPYSYSFTLLLYPSLRKFWFPSNFFANCFILSLFFTFFNSHFF